jgi:S-DNA-T family DNA segregation ATPase FtsK/SpoIIIE
MTIIFYLTGSTGTLGAGWTQMMEVGLGWGALIVPLVIGMLGIALFQSGHRNQSPLQPTQIIGTVLVMVAMLIVLEFGISPRQNFDDQIGSGGGSVGYVMLTLLSNAIGRPATFALSTLLGLAGIMLAFDITLVQILASIRHAFIVLWLTIRGDQSRVQPKRMPKQQSFVEDTGTSEAIITPIAERRTKAQYRE